jgi:hypothetical protein
LGQRKRKLTDFAHADLEDRLALFIETGRKEEIGGVVAQKYIVRKFYDREPNIEFFPGRDLAFPSKRVV